MRYDLMSRLLPRSRTRACHESLCHRDWHIDRFELQPECHRDGSAAAPILFPQVELPVPVPRLHPVTYPVPGPQVTVLPESLECVFYYCRTWGRIVEDMCYERRRAEACVD